MEAPQLRPLGVGDIVDRVFALYRSRPLMFLAVAAVPYLLLFVVIAGLGLAFATSLVALGGPLADIAAGRVPDLAAPSMRAAIVTAVALAIVSGVLAIVILSAQSAGLIAATSSLYLRRPVGAGEAFREGLRAAPRIIGASILVFLIVVVLWIALGVVLVLANQAIVFALGILFGFVAMIYIFASTLVAPVVATLEHAGPMTALRRSWWLSDGSRWRIIGLQLLLLVLNAVIGALLSALFLGSFISDVTARTIVQQVANLVTNVAWAPVQWGTFAVLYYDLRVRREAFDLQLAAEALPREP
ncbi:MAG TPA: hypothetical protein VFV20_03295 [Candidatus Limnocylindria bacterium]|nr:hypothetical protein [Candidatus Limnocylindria bacterium]